MIKSILQGLVALIISCGCALAQEATLLALKGDGTASVIIDDETRTAYITDGGRYGKSGIAEAVVDDKHILDYLTSRIPQDSNDSQTPTLVITCSHPHADHMGGLVSLVNDERILRFKRVVFVDANYSERGIKSLYDIYIKKWGWSSERAVRYESALNRDAFSAAQVGGDRVRVKNFVYKPERIGEHIHDGATIVSYELRDIKQTTILVDFDDASTKLLRHWVRPTRHWKPRVNVLVVPHHGSRHNNFSLLLANKKQLGLTDAVITVNELNQFWHPAPSVLFTLVKELGAEHVHITGSTMGDNIRVSAQGIETVDKPVRIDRVLKFVELQIDRYAAALRAVGERVEASGLLLPTGFGYRPIALESAILTGKWAAKPDFDMQKKSASEARRLTEGLITLLSLRQFISEKKGPAPSQVAALFRQGFGPDATAGEPAPAGGPNPSGGGSGAQEFLRRDRFISVEDKPLRDSGIPAMQIELSGYPRWGGVVLGNAPIGPPVKDLRFIVMHDPSSSLDIPNVALVMRSVDGTSGIYADVTPTELWAAYNFIQPTGELALKHKEKPTGGSVGFVGLEKKEKYHWSFAVHPAIADSRIARDAMMVDMFIATARTIDPRKLAPNLSVALGQLPKYHTYQWFDGESRLIHSMGQLSVLPKNQADNCLMQVRLVHIKKTIPPEELSDSKRQQFMKLDRNLSLAVGEDRHQAEWDLQAFWRRNMIKYTRHMPERFADSVCREYAPLDRLDRLARVVAILNWHRISTKGELPPFDAEVQPASFEVPAGMPTNAAFWERVLGQNGRLR